MDNKFNSGVSFTFAGGPESLFVEPIKAEIEALRSWAASLEMAFQGERIQIDELPKSKYIDKLGRRKTRAAGVTAGHHEDVYGRSEFIRQWDELLSRILAVATVRGGER